MNDIPAPPLYTLAYHDYYGSPNNASRHSSSPSILCTTSATAAAATATGHITRRGAIGELRQRRQSHPQQQQPHQAHRSNSSTADELPRECSELLCSDQSFHHEEQTSPLHHPLTPSSSSIKTLAQKLFPKILSPVAGADDDQEEEIIEYDDGFVGACSQLGSPTPFQSPTSVSSKSLLTNQPSYYGQEDDNNGEIPGLEKVEESYYANCETGEEPSDDDPTIVQYYSPNAARLIATLQTSPKITTETMEQNKRRIDCDIHERGNNKSGIHNNNNSNTSPFQRLLSEGSENMSAREFFMSTEDFFNTPGKVKGGTESNNEIAHADYREIEPHGQSDWKQGKERGSIRSCSSDSSQNNNSNISRRRRCTISSIRGALTSFLRFYAELLMLGLQMPRFLFRRKRS